MSFEEGVLLVCSALPSARRTFRERFLAELELREVVAAVAGDLWTHFGVPGRPPWQDADRYPPG